MTYGSPSRLPPPPPLAADYVAGYKHGLGWIPDSYIVDASAASATTPFALGPISVVNASAAAGGQPTTSLPLTFRAVGSWGVSDLYVYGTYSPLISGLGSALILHAVPLGWTDLYSYSGSGSNGYGSVIGNSFILDSTPGTLSTIDGPLFPGQSYVYGPWYSPASGQSVSAPGTSNGYSNTTSMVLIENLASGAGTALSLRTAAISAATGERPEGRGCDATGCAAPATPVQLTCGSGAVTATLSRLNPTALWRVTLPAGTPGPLMATFSTCGSSGGATELGAYRSIPYAQVRRAFDDGVTRRTIYVHIVHASCRRWCCRSSSTAPVSLRGHSRARASSPTTRGKRRLRRVSRVQ